MTSKIMLKVAGPMVALSLLLLAVGILAAVNVQKQQRAHAELVASEVNSMLAAEDVFVTLRDVRRELDLFLRTHDSQHLRNVQRLIQETRAPLSTAERLAHNQEQVALIQSIDTAVDEFDKRFSAIQMQDIGREADEALANLNDDFLTTTLLKNVRDCIVFNRQTIDHVTAQENTTARQMQIGFLLLGITGSVGGLLFGLGIARALSRSIVQLDVSVRSVAGKLKEVGGPVHISHLGDFKGLEFNVRKFEAEIIDIVERLQRREVELLRSEQLATVGQLAAGLAHELRNPLMPIKTLVQATVNRGEDGVIGGRSLLIIADEIARLERSIQLFLDFARPPALQTVESSIAEIIQSTIELMQSKAHQIGVVVQFIGPATPVIARIDRDQLRQLMLNLLLNSLDALRDSTAGRVTVQLSAAEDHDTSLSANPSRSIDVNSEHDALRIHEPLVVRDEFFTIHVHDNGAGFAQQVLERPFAPFVSTKE
ncbi:MAG: hypothetical protein JNM18_18300, partial [Planctomycetaceae bacterium]|nr:hypothetical protein [Planctomycetaceae bacterium]